MESVITKGKEIDLLKNYPRTKRDVHQRGMEKSEKDREIARKFGKDFFDGDRAHGYGGFNYHPRFWQNVIPDLISHFGLKPGDSILDIGCAKGFMLYDLDQNLSGLKLAGLDISRYALVNAISPIKEMVVQGNALDLPFADDSFDVVISINTVHNLSLEKCKHALSEIERVSRRGSFVTVDAFGDEEEKERMMAWNLTAQTILHTSEWKALFSQVGYTGDYYWFIP